MATLRGNAVLVCLSASFFRRSPLALGRWLPTFRAMAVSSVLKNSHSRTISRRMPAHVGAGVPANRNVHRGLSRSTYDSHRGEYYVDELLATQTSASNNDISGYTLCANEWDSFALPSTCDVAYGAKGSFVFRSAQSGTITFNNATFGDPAPGAPKKGYYRLSGGQRFYAHANSLYSVAALTNQAGGVVERYRYDTYGQRTTLAPDGVTTRAASSYNQQVGFTGRYLDKETGLYFFRNRMYSAAIGRFVSRNSFEKAPGPRYSVSVWNTRFLRLIFIKRIKAASEYVDGYGLYLAGFAAKGMLDPSGEPDDSILLIQTNPKQDENGGWNLSLDVLGLEAKTSYSKKFGSNGSLDVEVTASLDPAWGSMVKGEFNENSSGATLNFGLNWQAYSDGSLKIGTEINAVQEVFTGRHFLAFEQTATYTFQGPLNIPLTLGIKGVLQTCDSAAESSKDFNLRVETVPLGSTLGFTITGSF